MSQSLAPDARPEKPALRAIRAENPSAMTHSGTMTYLLGRGEVVVIDPGPDLAGHTEAILAALAPSERIVAVLLTHAHADHVGGLARLQSRTGAASYGFGPAGAGRSPAMQRLVARGLPDRGEGFDRRYAPDIHLSDGQTVPLGGIPIEVLHTPGHTGCSVSFAVGDRLFTGDLAMGWASSLVAPPDGDIGRYMASLARLSARTWSALYPGHGAPVPNPAERLAELARHRRQREAEILAVLAGAPSDIPGLAAAIYRDTPPDLRPAAASNVLAHLIDLEARGLVAADPAPLPWAIFALA